MAQRVGRTPIDTALATLSVGVLVLLPIALVADVWYRLLPHGAASADPGQIRAVAVLVGLAIVAIVMYPLYSTWSSAVQRLIGAGAAGLATNAFLRIMWDGPFDWRMDLPAPLATAVVTWFALAAQARHPAPPVVPKQVLGDAINRLPLGDVGKAVIKAALIIGFVVVALWAFDLYIQNRVLGG